MKVWPDTSPVSVARIGEASFGPSKTVRTSTPSSNVPCVKFNVIIVPSPGTSGQNSKLVFSLGPQQYCSMPEDEAQVALASDSNEPSS